VRNVVVVDASLALKWVLRESDSNIAFDLLTIWNDRGIVLLVPALFAYEAANTLYRNARKGEITLERAKEALTEVLLAGLKFDFSPDLTLSRHAIELASQYRLPATFDAHYLALAEREGCELWTADTRLWNTIRGKFSWVRWMGDYKPANLDISPGETEPRNT
jgi:predicted nucleic acid-binding protein